MDTILLVLAMPIISKFNFRMVKRLQNKKELAKLNLRSNCTTNIKVSISGVFLHFNKIRRLNKQVSQESVAAKRQKL